MGAEILNFNAARQAARRGEESYVRKTGVAEYFTISERTVERWQAQGMPCHRMGSNLTLYKISECDAWARTAWG